MTEAEWGSYTDPTPMLIFMQGRASARKLRLFGCACVRRVWHLLTEPRSRYAVEVAERFADGQAERNDLRTALLLSMGAYQSLPSGEAKAAARAASYTPRFTIASYVRGTVYSETAYEDDKTIMDLSPEMACQASLMRDIMGNPFRPFTIDSSWLSPTVVSLAEAAYEERALPSGHLDPIRLAILSDAMEDAGCTEPELLGHLRGEGHHWRGCWALDIVLGKS